MRESGETARERISVRKEAPLARFSPIPGSSQYHNGGLGQVRQKSHLEQFSELARRLPRMQNTQATKCWQPSSLCFPADE
ncbi:hypothetical protein AMECASPLE_025873 [Ameca splendens]|uniref:Uncharacterized protein n=1 Tax=Ameca splendens TaxID=208324 RepID=A0ABV0Y4Z6_9TELE